MQVPNHYPDSHFVPFSCWLCVFQILYLMSETEANIHLNKEYCMKWHGRISFWILLLGLELNHAATLPCFYSDPALGGNHININHVAFTAGPSYASEWAPVLLLSVQPLHVMQSRHLLAKLPQLKFRYHQPYKK